MSGPASWFGRRSAAADSGVRRGRPALRPASDTILSPPGSRASAAVRLQNPLFVAAILLAAMSLAAALIQRVLMLDQMDQEVGAVRQVVGPLVAGLLAILVMAGRGIDRGRALAVLAIIAVLCPLLVGWSGDGGYTGIAMMTATATAFVALPVALDWIGSTGTLSALRAGVLTAAPALGATIGNAISPDLLSSDHALPGWSIMLLVPVVTVGLIAARQPARDDRLSLVATQQLLGSQTLLAVLAAGLAASASSQILLSAFRFADIGAETFAELIGLSQIGSMIALIAGGLLADRRARDHRGYAAWFAATLGLAGIVALASQSLGPVPAGLGILAAEWILSAGVGAALALVFRLASPAARLGAIMLFAAARFIGGTVLAPLLLTRFVGSEGSGAAGLGATGLILAAAIIAVSEQPFGRRRR